MPRNYVETASNVDSVEFNGKVYRRYPDSPRQHLRRYYSRSRELLHRVVWTFHHGAIPPGHHVHHKDGNHLNNHIDNLECLSVKRHHELHGPTRAERNRSQAQLDHLAAIRPAAAKWHSSPEGVEWHAAHGKKSWENRTKVALICNECHGEFESFFSDAQFCSRSCQNRNWYKAHPDYEQAKRARRKAARLQSHSS